MRTPLRPLARILRARQMGENPDLIERENLAQRHEAMRARTQGRASARLGLLALAFGCLYLTIGVRMGHLAASEPMEPVASAPGPRSWPSAPTSSTATAGSWPPT